MDGDPAVSEIFTIGFQPGLLFSRACDPEFRESGNIDLCGDDPPVRCKRRTTGKHVVDVDQAAAETSTSL